MFFVQLAACDNPDYNHAADAVREAPARRVKVKDLAEAAQVCRQYIDEHDLGAGHWTGGQVFEGETQVARVSYNGRLWYPGPYPQPEIHLHLEVQ